MTIILDLSEDPARSDKEKEVIETALAHLVCSRVEAAYVRSDPFDRRRVLASQKETGADPAGVTGGQYRKSWDRHRTHPRGTVGRSG